MSRGEAELNYGQGRPIDRLQYKRPKLVAGIDDEVWNALKIMAMMDKVPIGILVNEALNGYVSIKRPELLAKRVSETKRE